MNSLVHSEACSLSIPTEQAQKPASHGWRTIDSAPLDGSLIWLGKPYALRVGFWSVGKQYEHKGSVGGGWRDLHEGRDLNFVPTHWQPTPRPPENVSPDQPASHGEGGA